MLGKAGIFAAALVSGAAHAQDSDWSGPYLGLQIAGLDGTHHWSDGPYPLETGGFVGGFGGYMWQRDRLVYGVEIAAQTGKAREADYPALWLETTLDLKARVGLAQGTTLLYASAGYSVARLAEDGDSFQADGVVIGLGADVRVSDRVILGAALDHRIYDGTCTHDLQMDGKASSVTLRAAWTF